MSARRRRRNKNDKFETVSDEDINFNEPPTACDCPQCRFQGSKPATAEKIASTEKLLDDVNERIQADLDSFIEELGEFVKLKSVSRDRKCADITTKMVEKVHITLERMGFTVSPFTIKPKGDKCDEMVPAKMLLASHFSSPTKNTLLIYGSCDVVPTQKNEGWLFEPFVMTSNGQSIFGRGVSRNKGPLVGWLSAIKTWKSVHQDLPINIKYIIDPNSESGNVGLHELIDKRRDFFGDVDYILFPAHTWLNHDTPVISCCLSGWAHFGIEVQGGNRVVDSGLAGGMVFEPMIDLCHLMNSLVDNSHDIAVPRIVDMVRTISQSDWDLLESATFSEYDYKESLMVRRCRYDLSKVTLLKHRWCNTALTMHGIEGIQSGPDAFRSIPMSVLGKFSLKLMPNQDANKAFSLFHEYLQARHHELNASTVMQLHVLDWADPIVWSFNTKHTQALARSLTAVYSEEPAFSKTIATCMPIATYIQKMSGKPVILMPVGLRVMSRYTPNESTTIEDFQNIVRLCAKLMCELSYLPVRCKCDAGYKYCQRQGITEILEEQNAKTVDGQIEIPEPRKKGRKKKKSVINWRKYSCWPRKSRQSL